MPVDRITCTLIPGDGVYPELMDSVKTVLKAIGAPIDFETMLFSEVQHSSSAKVEDVIKSINRNRICLMVVIIIILCKKCCQFNINLLFREH